MRAIAPVVTLPQVVVRLGGQDISDQAHVVAWDIFQRTNAPSECVITIDAPHDEVHSRCGDGTPLQVHFDNALLFEGQLCHWHCQHQAGGSTRLEIRAWDALGELADAQELRVFEDQSTLGIIRTIAGGHGLSVQGSDGPTWERWYQLQHSDLDSVVQCCQRSGRWCSLIDKTLHIFDATGIGQRAHVTNDHIIEASFHRQAAACPQHVRAEGWHSREVRAVSGASRSSISGSPDAGSRTVPGLSADDPDQLHHLGQAVAWQRQLHAIRSRVTIPGNHTWRPGMQISFTNIAGAPSGDQLIFNVHHACDGSQGYTTTLDSEPPPLAPIERGALLAFGTVTAVDDPHSMGRIRVQLPSYGNLETHWLPVVAAGAAANKGLVVMPDRDDSVAILAPNHDFAHAVVLGGVNGKAGAYDGAGVDGGRTKRYHFSSPDGHRLSLDESKGELVLTHAGGSHMTMSTNKTVIESKGDLTISAPGKSITISANAVDFQRG